MYALRTLYGTEYEKYKHNNETEKSLWRKLEAGDARHDIMLANTSSSGNPLGLLPGHEFTVLGVKKINDDAGNEVRLVKLRDPYSTDKYDGDYSDNSPLWTS